ncbi:MAG: GTP 3',8-cyclase MoaA [Phycisphaerales bacterium]|nr:GTP 3',8-cyclase MoaA [Phycisphaerales bacterium]
MVAPRVIPLPVLGSTSARPVFARGPRDLASLKLLRISVTDRCNLRCVYCMPEEGVAFGAREQHLSPAEIEAVARTAVDLGVRHLKLTGGEPTIRRDILEIVERLASLGAEDLSLTTNALQLPRLAAPLRAAGVDRVTISVDSLRPERYREITGGGRLDLLQRGLDAAATHFPNVKINAVVIRGMNDDEVAELAALTLAHDWTVRFIEYMPLGDSTLLRTSPEAALVTAGEMVRSIEAMHGPLEPVARATEAGVGPAEVFRLQGAQGRVGFIHAMSRPFCETCNRLRLTAEGELRACLFDGGEVSLLDALRPVADPDRLRNAFVTCLAMKPEVHGRRGMRAMSQLGG